MITHYPSLLRAPLPAGLRHLTPHAFHFTATVYSPLPPPPFRVRPLRAAAGGGSPVAGDGGKRATPPPLGPAVLDFVRSNFLPLALIGGIALALLDPTLGCLAHKYSLSKYSTFGIFIISGLTLRTKELGAALQAWPAGLFGLGSILMLTPFLAKFIVQIQFFPREFITGLAMFCCMPTTLSSGVTLTQLAGGNSALALAMTVISNLLGIIFVPLSLAKYIGAGAGVSLPTEKLFKSLVSTLLIPLILGKVPWIQVSRSRSMLLSVQAKAFAITVTIGVLLHLALLAFNATALQLLSCLKQKEESVFTSKEYSRAVILVASQKTLPVLVAVVEQLGGALGESGFLVIPCVAAHINQIIIDSILVNWWRQRDQQSTNAK
ncbi:probable sodium/metabolite cotransporter BASS4, chloroplastic isoform X2 [Lolium perenne]|uniref:probable sodium/metabolite cotransporter BASS4, chloroplastic isoform X2 n=1 Tax=Lolium perenne TaxID=4522 RepID=UPI0021F605D9|nr:probable sodium/metabolite cotransporter BASS4, chloroplastic isoform X1 [Lolium perenne]